MEVRRNAYPGICRSCGGKVAENEGRIEQSAAGRWLTYHLEGACPEATLPTRPGTDSAAMDTAVDKVIGLMTARFMELIPDVVQENLHMLSRVAEIKIGKMPPIKVDTAHKMLPVVLRAVTAGVHPFVVGPAGSGKTTLAEQIAKVLKLNFYMEARVTSEFKLLGFINAQGDVIRTQFREAYEHGGVFLFDEADASDADALTAVNSALANGWASFPDGLIRRHKDFIAIMAGNTFGRGADRQYVGRNQLDAATLDRFVIYEVDYDEDLEITLAGNVEWTRHVQAVRRAISVEKVRHIVSPRASMAGAKLLAADEDRHIVEEACIWKGLDEATRKRVEARMAMEVRHVNAA